MRARSIVVLVSLLAAVVIIAGCAKTNQNTGQASPGSSPTAAASSPGATPAASPSPVGGAAATGSPGATGSPSATGSVVPTETAPPTPKPTPATPPPGLPAGWEKQYERVENGREAQLLVRTGA